MAKVNRRYNESDIFNLKPSSRNSASVGDSISNPGPGMNRTYNYGNVNKTPIVKKEEKRIDVKLRDHSPFINGLKNQNFIPPHFKSNVNIGGTSEANYEEIYKNRREPGNTNSNINNNSRSSTAKVNRRGENKNGDNLQEGDLVCNNCINGELAKSKNIRPQTDKEGNNNIRDHQEKMNMITKHLINAKINERMNLSEIASKNTLNAGNMEKDKLISLNEK
jgi:hypothetical protein